MSARYCDPTRTDRSRAQRSRAQRSGGALAALVVSLITLVLLVGTATGLVRSGTERTLGRTGDIRLAVEAGEAALAEAAAVVRVGLDGGGSHLPTTGDDFRLLALDALSGGARTHGQVEPASIRALLRQLGGAPVTIDRVDVSILPRVRILPAGGAATLPQALLETRVTVRTDGSAGVRRTVTQRRILYATGARPTLTLISDPIATVVE